MIDDIFEMRQHLKRKLMTVTYGRYDLRGCKLGRNVHTTGRVQVSAEGALSIGDGVTLFGGMIPTRLVCARDAELSIDEASELNFGVSVSARRSVRIGKRCMIAPFVEIDDSADSPREPRAIVIGDDVWLAYGAIVMPGVRIGRGAVVSAGSVVKSDVAPYSLAIGNPARVMPLDIVAPH